MKNMKKIALVAVAGTALLQFGGCLNVVLAGVASGLGISIISQILPLGVTTTTGNLF